MTVPFVVAAIKPRLVATITLAAVLATTIISGSPAQTISPVPSLREQAEIQQQWLKLRLERVLPRLLRKHRVAMWLVICREYNEDPVFFSLVSPTVFAARRRTIYVFFDRGEGMGVERLALGGGSNGGLYTVYRDPDVENREIYGEGQWVLLRKLIDERKPETIAINVSSTHAFSDGLSAGEKEKLDSVLGPEHLKRIVRAENLPLEYIETRLPEMLPVYRRMMQTVHSLISRAFSSEVIKPGKTTNEDVVWWLRQQVNDLGLGTSFLQISRFAQQGGVMFSDDEGLLYQVSAGSLIRRLRSCTRGKGRNDADCQEFTEHLHLHPLLVPPEASAFDWPACAGTRSR